MSFDINSTAQQIFTNLSVRDGKSDDKIGLKSDGTYDNSIWNSFANAAGGNQVKNYIEKGNALNSIKTYLQRAINDMAQLTQIASAGGVTINTEPTAQETVVKAESPVSAPTTGDVVAVRNDDGTTYQINSKDHTITKFDADGNVIEQRAMTDDEQALSTNELITNLQKPAVPAQDVEVKDEPPVSTPAEPVEPVEPTEPVERNIKSAGISGTYTITDNDNGGYTLNKNLIVSVDKNQAAQAFKKGMTNEFGLVNVKRDSDGLYNFRGIKTKSYNVLSTMVIQKSQQIAEYTAIFNDLKAKQDNGETLSTGEQKFMSDYNEMLTKNGLQMNDNGELEDIPTPKTKRHRH